MDTNTSENSIDDIQNTDETSESDTLPLIKRNLKKAPLKRKNINKSPIENDSSSDNKSIKKKKRFTPPYGKTRRIRWTEEEKKTALFLFEKYINNFTLPSLKEITSRDNILKNRQPATIKTWLHNQIRAKK